MNYGKLLLVIGSGDEREYLLEKDVITLGRDLDNDILLPSPTVSRHHARLTLTPVPVIEDLHSSFGTFVGEEQITRHELHSGDIISVAGMQLRFDLPPQEEVSQHTIIDLNVDAEPALQEAALKATLSHTLLNMPPDVAGEASRQDATLQVVIADSTARLVVREHDVSRDVPLGNTPVVIGRGAGCQVVLNDQRVSRRHAELRPDGDGYVLVDLGSANGTQINGRTFPAPIRLADGDLLTVGDTLIVYRSTVKPAPVIAPPAVRARVRRPIVIIPGIMGSGLKRGNITLWPNYPYALSHPFALLPNSGPVEVTGLIHDVVVVPYFVKVDSYNRLTDFLAEALGYRPGIDLLEFPYDWRQDNRITAKKLSEAIKSWRETVGHGPVTIIAHSMGGLVARHYIDKLDGHDHVEQLIVMGTPHQGTTKAASVLLGGIGASPFGIAAEKVRSLTLSMLPSYEVLPRYPSIFSAQGDPIDLLTDKTWLAPENHDMLNKANEFMTSLSPKATVPTLCVIGYGRPTMVRIIVDRQQPGWKVMRYEMEPVGDGGVIEQSAMLEGAEIHPVHQDHGSLFADPDVHRRLRYELLERRGS